MLEIDKKEILPEQYTNGWAVFLGMKVKVDKRVLIPRPETELLVTVSARYLREKNFIKPRIMEIGTGSGAVALGLAKLVDDCSVTATDISADAIAIATENFKLFGLGKRVKTIKSDMFEAFDKSSYGHFDAIVSNPPYVSSGDYGRLDGVVKKEPKSALIAGMDGLDFIRVIASKSMNYLKSGGFLALEIGFNQAEEVKNILAKNGFIYLSSFKDFNGIDRIIAGWKNG